MKKNKELMKKIFRFQALMQRYMSQKIKKHGSFRSPHQGQGRVLGILKMQPEISQKELAYLLGIRSQSLGELLKKLEANGLVERTPSEKDRRIMMVKVTEEGKKAAEEVGKEQAERVGVFQWLNEEEIASTECYLG